MSSETTRSVRSSGGYRDVRAVHVATIICEATAQFCHRFLDPRSRLIGQVTQAAGSVRQNIAEGSRASATSGENELRLLNVVRGGLDELLLAYEDFLRQRKIRQWTKDDPEAQAVRSIATRRSSDQSDYSLWLTATAPGIVANCLICLIHQANYLLDQQSRPLEKTVTRDDGIAEHPRQIVFDPSTPSSTQGPIPGAPSCPKCGKPMSLRTARKGMRPGSQFWGCSQYPSCKAIRNLE